MESLRLISWLTAVIVVGVVTSQSLPPGNADPTNQEHTHEVPSYYKAPDAKKVKDALGKLFDEKLDTNKDNYVDAKEMKAWLKVVHGSMIDDNIDRQWDYFADKLQDGSLAWEEYRKVTFTDEESSTLQGDEKKQYDEQLRRTERRWKHADENGDGLLSKVEFKTFLHPEEDETKNDIVVTESIEMMDLNDDQIISMSEYLEHLKSVAGPEKNDEAWVQEQEAHFSTYLDKNKDATLDRQEMKEWVIPQFDREEGEAWRFISFADQDRDTKLTRTDIVQNSEHFVGLLPAEFWVENAHRHDGQDLEHNEL